MTLSTTARTFSTSLSCSDAGRCSSFSLSLSATAPADFFWRLPPFCFLPAEADAGVFLLAVVGADDAIDSSTPGVRGVLCAE